MKQKKRNNGITLLGLGPGDPEMLTREANDWLNQISRLYLRTDNHPLVPFLSEIVEVISFDDLINQSASLDEANKNIMKEILALGASPEGVTYAVPGDPYFGEAICAEIKRRADEAHIPIRVIHGISILEPILAALNLGSLSGVVIVDALALTKKQTPGFAPSTPALITQFHSSKALEDVKRVLMTAYPGDHPVQLVHAAGTKDEKIENLRLDALGNGQRINLTSSIYVPPLSEFASFESFQEIIARLRAPGGCPWDQKQTHASLRPFLLEETYEALDALDREDKEDLQEELGDLLLQILLHAQIASETGDFNIHHVIDGIGSKLVRRHPHVFADIRVDGEAGVIQNWEAIKAEERLENNKRSKKGLLDGVPQALPALSQSQAVIERVGRMALDQLFEGTNPETIAKSLQAFLDAERDKKSALLGELLMDLVALIDRSGIDAESALRENIARFRSRFSQMERLALNAGLALADLSVAEKQALWDRTNTQDDQQVEV